MRAAETWKGKRILVIGDLMLDRFIWGEVERISPEAPVQVVKVDKESCSPGGAANTAANISALGGEAYLAGLIGKDPAGESLRGLLEEAGIDTSLIDILPKARTIEKMRLVGRNQQIARIDYDYEFKAEQAQGLYEKAIQKLEAIDAVLISDYEKGTINESIRQLIQEAKKQGIPVIADPKPANAELYSGVTLLTPNLKEAGEIAGYAGSSDQDMEKICRIINKRLSCDVLITRGSEGMTLMERKGRVHHIPTTAHEVYDVSGAGDTVASVMALGLASGAGLEKAAHLANTAAGIAVGKLGTAVVTSADLSLAAAGHAKERSLEELKLIVADARHMGKRVVWTNGCFDLLHAGHITYLRKAKKLGDILIVGLNSDSSVKELKGDKRPILDENDRSMIISALEAVDYVLIFDDKRVTSILKELKPDVFVKGGDYTLDTLDQEERKVVEGYGGKIELIRPVKDRSTTNIVERIVSLNSS